MATHWMCLNPDHPEQKHPRYYDINTVDGFCPDCPYGTGILVEDEEPARGPGPSGDGIVQPTDKVLPGVPIGLCILACDVSGSMQEPFLSGSTVRKLDAVVRNMANGIADLYKMAAEKEAAFVTVVAFGAHARQLTDDAGKPFIKSIASLAREFPTVPELTNFLNRAFDRASTEVDSNYTNINEALILARSMHTAAIGGNMSQWGLGGSFQLKQQPVFPAAHVASALSDGSAPLVPNIRALIYSDGMQNASDGSALGQSPWATDSPSTLMTMYFGSDTDPGAAEMRSLAGQCPKHNAPSFFMINNAERYQTLRGLFRMASGASGFCAACVAEAEVQYRSTTSAS